MNNSLIQSLESHRQEIIEFWYATQFDEGLIRKYGIRGLESDDRMWVRPCFLHPLLNLFIEYLRTGEERYLVVYQDERLRYAPHQAPPDERAQFFQCILQADEAAVLNAVEDRDRTSVKKVLSDLHAPFLSKPSNVSAPVHLLSLGDCLMNEIRVFLSHRARQMQIPLDMRILYFSAAMSRGLSVDEVVDYLAKNKVDFISMSFFSFEGIPAYSAFLREADKLSIVELEKRVAGMATLIRDFVDCVREHTSAPFLIHDAGGLPLTGIRRCIPVIPVMSRARKQALFLLNQAIRNLILGLPKCALISETEVTEREGLRACSKPLIPNRVAAQGYFHTSVFGNLMSEQYLPVIKSYQKLRRAKLLLVDFDNTLWEGVMADGPVRHHVEKQHLLRRLKEAGILLVALSKNTPENIRWDEIVIKPEDFVLLKINWDLKAKSVQETAAELNLGMDSFVLLDDNPAEIDLMRQTCPLVVSLDSRAEETWAMLDWLRLFSNTQDTKESRARTEMYRAQAARQKSIASEIDCHYPQMMRSLRLCVNFRKAELKDLDRLAELINRTNQFNTTTIRYSKNNLRELITANETALYVADLEDKFGKLGLVTAAVVKRQDEARVIDLFVMSCRAMGFGLENYMLRKIVEAESVEGKKFIGRYIPNDRNMPAASLFKNNRFEPLSETDWCLLSIDAMPSEPEWFAAAERA